jgi:hypothetical protein
VAGSLAEALAARDNDYRDLVAEFCRRTRLGWHDPTPPAGAAGTQLSVVIPARDTDHSLATVLDAVADQRTSGGVEVIVIDDASTDDTPAIAADHPVVDLAYRLPYQVGARAHPELVLVGFRHNIAYQDAGHRRARIPEGEPDLDADYRMRWSAPAGVPMFYSGQVYPQPFIGRPLEHTHEFLDLGHAAMYHDWDLPRMVVTALAAAPRARVLDVGGFDAGFDAHGWGTEDTHLGAMLIAAGCKVTPLRQVRGFHIDPPDAAAQWQAKFATAAPRIDYYRRLLNQPTPCGRAGELARRAERLLHHAEDLR